MIKSPNLPRLSSMLRIVKAELQPEISIEQTALVRIENLSILSNRAALDRIELLEDEMKDSDDAVKLPVKEYYGKDVYVRETFFKAGTIATGRVHKFDHISILISGHMTIWTPFDGVHDVYGPSITEVPAGMKRVGYAHTDTHWVTAHGLKNGVNAIESLTFSKYGEYLTFLTETERGMICHLES